MTFLYYVLFCVAHILALPFLCMLAFKEKYKKSIPSRFLFPKIRINEKYDIWLHACSMGEVQSLQTLIESIPKEQSAFITVITQTGFMQAQKLFAERKNLQIDYLPFETLLPLCAPTCKKLLVFEAELWLMLFVCAKKRGATTKLINARISTRSFHRYQKLGRFYTHIFSFIDSVLSQSNEDTNRLQLLGAKHVETLGNIKILNPIKPKIIYKKPQRPLFVAASTHADEEKLILAAWQEAKAFLEQKSTQNTESIETLRNDVSRFLYNLSPHNTFASKTQNTPQNTPLSASHSIQAQACPATPTNTKDSIQPLLIVVPRHPERFGTVYALCKEYGTTLRLSALGRDCIDFMNLNAEILLVDVMGALIDFYAISDVVILGGAFAKIGGHNPLEPASFCNVLLSGTEIFNQKALFACVQNYYLVDNKEDLARLLSHYTLLSYAHIDTSQHANMIERILL